jgi:hypothetical protein
MKPNFTLRDLFWLVLVLGLAYGWWQAHEALSLASERNRVLESWVEAAKDAGWRFAYGKGEGGETTIVQTPR